MEEKVLVGKKNGMLILLLEILLMAASIAGIVFGAIILEKGGLPVLFIISLVVLLVGWIPLCGLKVLKPQEARHKHHR